MPFRVTCTTCGTRFALSDELYERKIKNRIVTIRCKSCSSDISVDGEALAVTAASVSSTANEPVIDADSLPPSDKPPGPDLTPTVPLKTALERAADAQQTPTPAIEAKSRTEGLWVVCCPDEDDRELTLPEIEAAIAKNEINGDAIVWRDGMAEWLPIHQVPELRVLLKKPPLPKPKGRTLLGIGVKPNASATATPRPVPKAPVSDPDNEPLSVEPEPLSESSAELLQRKGGPVALSPGLLSVKRADEAARPEPPPRRRQDSIPEPPPRPKLDSIPEPPPRPKLDSKPDAPARPRMDSKPEGIRAPPKPPSPVRPVQKLLIEGRPPDSAPDSSGTPALRALASIGPKKSGRPEAEKKPPADDFMWGGPSDTELLGAPTIDVAGLSGPPAAGPAAKSEAPPSSTRKKKKSKRPKAPVEPSAEKVVESAPADPPPSKPEPEKKSGGGFFLLIAAAVLLVGGFLLVRGKGTKTETPPEPVAVPVAAPPPPAPATEHAPTAPPAADPIPAPTAEAQNPIPQATAEPTAPSKPVEPKASPATERPVREEPTGRAEPKPAAAEAEKPKPAEAEKPKPGEKPVASAAPEKPAEAAPGAEFDRAAASAALSAAAAQAAACRKEGDPTGAAAVVVTFAPSGRVTSANVNGPPFAGTATGGCIAAAMRGAKVPPFSGAHVTVGKTVAIR